MPTPTVSGLRVLVVDDEESARILFREYLTLEECKVEVAEAGEEALAKIYNFHPEVVLLDVLMPRLTGNELVRMIKEWKPEIKVIMVSANASIDVEKDCLHNGAYACLRKPVKLDTLINTIKQALV